MGKIRFIWIARAGNRRTWHGTLRSHLAAQSLCKARLDMACGDATPTLPMQIKSWQLQSDGMIGIDFSTQIE